MKSILVIIFIFSVLEGFSQTEQDLSIDNKNYCFEYTLKQVSVTANYQRVHNQFLDTFNLLKNQVEYFGLPELVELQIDDAVFFSKDSIKCLLLVLQRNKKSSLVFGSARVIEGILQEKGGWQFAISESISFDKQFFNKYQTNNFENISKLARHSILTTGSTGTDSNCFIDEYYWFNQ